MARRNSGSSSKNSTPLWARLISPGVGLAEPPSKPASEMEWCGERKGRWAMKADGLPASRPQVLWILVVSMASSSDIDGIREGMRFANIDLPEPGEPSMSRLWPPLTATSMARLA